MCAIKLVIFDFDGTLVYSLDAFVETINLVLKNLGFPSFPRKKIMEIAKLPFDKYISIIIPSDTPNRTSVVAKFEREFKRIYGKNHLKLIKPVTNALLTLKRLCEMGLSIGVVTARKLIIDHVKEELEFLSLNSFIRIIVTFNDIPFQEPTKVNLISKCIRRLNVKSRECIVVGDSPEDILAGRKIGALTVGALYGFYGEKNNGLPSTFYN